MAGKDMLSEWLDKATSSWWGGQSGEHITAAGFLCAFERLPMHRLRYLKLFFREGNSNDPLTFYTGNPSETCCSARSTSAETSRMVKLQHRNEIQENGFQPLITSRNNADAVGVGERTPNIKGG